MAESGHILICACDRLYKTGAGGDDAVEREIDFLSLPDLERNGRDDSPFSQWSGDFNFKLIFFCSQEVLATALDMGETLVPCREIGGAPFRITWQHMYSTSENMCLCDS